MLLELLDVFEAVAPSMVGGTSFPILVYLEGKTKFYDFQGKKGKCMNKSDFANELASRTDITRAKAAEITNAM